MDQSPLFNIMMQRQMAQGPQGPGPGPSPQGPPPQGPPQQGPKMPPTQANGMWSTSTPSQAGPPPGMPPQSAAGGMAPPMGGQQSIAPGTPPPAGPPQVGGQTNTHSQNERAQTAGAMQSAYQNNWQPNPMILRMMAGKT